MAKKRKKKRPGNPASKGSQTPKPQNSATESKPGNTTKVVKATIKSSSKKSSKSNKYTPSPIAKDGSLRWGRVDMPRVSQPSELELTLPEATLRDQELPALAWLLGIISFFGIVFSTSWSPVLLAVLAAVTLLDQKIRENKWAVLQVCLAVILCLACWPLIDQVKAITTLSMNQLAAITLVVFAGALWLTGIVTRRASLLQNTLFSRTGLYSIGVACQSLSVVVMFVGIIQLYILVV